MKFLPIAVLIAAAAITAPVYAADDDTSKNCAVDYSSTATPANIAAATSVTVVKCPSVSGGSGISSSQQAALTSNDAVNSALADQGASASDVVASSLDGKDLTLYVHSS